MARTSTGQAVPGSDSAAPCVRAETSGLGMPAHSHRGAGPIPRTGGGSNDR